MKKIILIAVFFFSIIPSAFLFAQSEFENFSNGEIICSDNGQFMEGTFRTSNLPYDNMIIGVIQKSHANKTAASPSSGGFSLKQDGVCDVKYNSENGAIKKGDILTSSSSQGEAMKATKSGTIIGVALEDASSPSGLLKIRVMIQYVKQ